MKKKDEKVETKFILGEDRIFDFYNTSVLFGDYGGDTQGCVMKKRLPKPKPKTKDELWQEVCDEFDNIVERMDLGQSAQG